MKVLLDTSAFLWAETDRSRFGPWALDVIDHHDSEFVLSAASAWEISIKYTLGKIALPSLPHEYVTDRMQMSGINALPVEIAHALHVATLPLHHRDPFDRVLVAQAQLESLTILTSDRSFDLYDVEVLWAN